MDQVKAVHEGSCHASKPSKRGARCQRREERFVICSRPHQSDNKKRMTVLDHPGLEADAADPIRKALQDLSS